MAATKDISTQQNTYTFHLLAHTDEINDVFNNPNTSADALKTTILNSISEANNTAAKKRFVNNVTKQNNKNQIIFTVWNAIGAGCGLALH